MTQRLRLRHVRHSQRRSPPWLLRRIAACRWRCPYLASAACAASRCCWRLWHRRRPPAALGRCISWGVDGMLLPNVALLSFFQPGREGAAHTASSLCTRAHTHSGCFLASTPHPSPPCFPRRRWLRCQAPTAAGCAMSVASAPEVASAREVASWADELASRGASQATGAPLPAVSLTVYPGKRPVLGQLRRSGAGAWLACRVPGSGSPLALFPRSNSRKSLTKFVPVPTCPNERCEAWCAPLEPDAPRLRY